MKLFAIFYTNHDTCGNEWASEKPTRYVLEESIKNVWIKLQSPEVTLYTVNNKNTRKIRTPKGMGYGIWEANPEFDWSKNMDNATRFICGGFESLVVSELLITKL